MQFQVCVVPSHLQTPHSQAQGGLIQHRLEVPGVEQAVPLVDSQLTKPVKLQNVQVWELAVDHGAKMMPSNAIRSSSLLVFILSSPFSPRDWMVEEL